MLEKISALTAQLAQVTAERDELVRMRKALDNRGYSELFDNWKSVCAERDALKATIVATIGGTDDEGNPTSEINYLQRLRRLVAFERDGLEAMRQNAIFYSSLDSTETENAKLKQERDALRVGLKRLEWYVYRHGEPGICKACGAHNKREGHKPDCWLAALIGEGK